MVDPVLGAFFPDFTVFRNRRGLSRDDMASYCLAYSFLRSHTTVHSTVRGLFTTTTTAHDSAFVLYPMAMDLILDSIMTSSRYQTLTLTDTRSEPSFKLQVALLDTTVTQQICTAWSRVSRPS